MGSEVEVVVLLNGWTQGSEYSEGWKPGWGLEWNCSQLTYNWRELRTVVETLKREEVVSTNSEVEWYFTSQTMKSPTPFAKKDHQKPSHYIF
jgi:hypothetical protein